MVIIRIMGGPGNQFFQYSFAKKLALLLNTNFKLDLDYNKTINDTCFGVNYVLDKYMIEQNFSKPDEVYLVQNQKEENKLLEKIKKLKGLKGLFLRKLFMLFPEYYLLSSSHIKDIFNDKTIYLIERIEGDAYLDGYWGKHLFFNDIIDDLREELKVKDSFKNKEYYTYKESIEKANIPVSIHIRRGTYTYESFKSFFGLLPMKYYSDAYNYINKIVPGKKDFYVFSDNMRWAEKNLQFIANKTLIYCGAGNDFLEHELMSLCHHNIIANSTFSWWAGYLNANPQKIIIAPKIWYASRKAQKRHQKSNFIPKDWIQL